MAPASTGQQQEVRTLRQAPLLFFSFFSVELGMQRDVDEVGARAMGGRGGRRSGGGGISTSLNPSLGFAERNWEGHGREGWGAGNKSKVTTFRVRHVPVTAFRVRHVPGNSFRHFVYGTCW